MSLRICFTSLFSPSPSPDILLSSFIASLIYRRLLNRLSKLTNDSLTLFALTYIFFFSLSILLKMPEYIWGLFDAVAVAEGFVHSWFFIMADIVTCAYL